MGSKGGLGAVFNPIGYVTGYVSTKVGEKVGGDKGAKIGGLLGAAASGTEIIGAAGGITDAAEEIKEKKEKKAAKEAQAAATAAAIAEVQAAKETSQTNAAAKIRAIMSNRTKTVYTTALGAADTGDGTGAPVKKKTLLGG